jgi:FMN phosphatase YigB (HAD superfamily)
MSPDAIVLDLDDTLFDTTRLLLPGADRRAAAAFRAAGLALDEPEILRRIEALRAAGSTSVFREIAAASGAPAGAAAAAEDAWFDYDPPPMRLDDDVAAALDELAVLAPLALLTSGHPDTQRRKVDRLGIAARFAECRFVDFRDPGGKTAALGEMLRARGWSPPRTMMVGDRPDGDVRAGNRVGCLTVLVRREGGEYSRVPASSPDDRPWRTVGHVREVADLVRGLDVRT